MSLTQRLRAAEHDRSSSLAHRAMRAPDRRRVELPSAVTAAMSRVLDRECPGYRANLAAAPAARGSALEGEEVEGAVPGNGSRTLPIDPRGAEAADASLPPPLLAAPAGRVDPEGSAAAVHRVETAPEAGRPATPALPEAGVARPADVECVACRGAVEVVRIDLVQHLLHGACRSCGLETTRALGDTAVAQMRDLADSELEAEPAGPPRRRGFWQLGQRPG